MSPRPTIFISSVSKELRSARQLVANTLTFLGYEPIWQDIFGTEGGDLRQMLRQQIDQSKGVVQLIGQAYGAEPPAPDEEFGRVSYTQYEALYARKRGKKVWYLFMDESFPIDPHEPEPEELRQLQAAYRNILKVDTHLFHPLATREALEAGVLKLRDDLTQLRKGAKRWAWGIAALLVFVALMVMWLVRGQGETKASLDKIAQRFESLSSSGGLITNAKTPEEHYHNARDPRTRRQLLRRAQGIHRISFLESRSARSLVELFHHAEIGGRQGRCRGSHALFWRQTQAANSFLPDCARPARGRGGAPERNSRRSPAANPDFGPLAWLISQEYSEARRGDQTLADQRAEKEWLEKFRAAHAAGKFEKYFLDKKEAQKWIDAGRGSLGQADQHSGRVLENPVTLTAQQSSGGWAVIFSLTDFKAKELFYKLDGKGDFQSTGHLPYKNPQTGLPMMNTHLPLPNLAPGEHTIEVKYVGQEREDQRPLHPQVFHRRRTARAGKDGAQHDRRVHG